VSRGLASPLPHTPTPTPRHSSTAKNAATATEGRDERLLFFFFFKDNGSLLEDKRSLLKDSRSLLKFVRGAMPPMHRPTPAGKKKAGNFLPEYVLNRTCSL
jgi:hypothetical protein